MSSLIDRTSRRPLFAAVGLLLLSLRITPILARLGSSRRDDGSSSSVNFLETNTAISIGSNIKPKDESTGPSVESSSSIPSLTDTTELAHLSSMVYGFRSGRATNCSAFDDIFQEYVDRFQPSIFIHGNATYECHLYEQDKQDTQVMVLSKQLTTRRTPSTLKDISDASYTHDDGYIAIVYAGTDDFRTALADFDLFTTPFGPSVPGPNGTNTYPLIPDDSIRVHAGFNNAVFSNNLFNRIHDKVNQIKNDNPSYRLLTTGHSLGAADAILTAVAMKLQPSWKDEYIASINFGCPKTGNWAWSEYVNSMDGLGIWRVVNGVDLVPRLPDFRFHHAGHTLQLDSHRARAFWLHEGDKKLGYKGIPFRWNILPYALAPAAAYAHIISHYTKYLDKKSRTDKHKFYIYEFEKVGGRNDDDDDNGNDVDMDDDDTWWNVPDDALFEEDMDKSFENEEYTREFLDEYLQLYGEEYLRFVQRDGWKKAQQRYKLNDVLLQVPDLTRAG